MCLHSREGVTQCVQDYNTRAYFYPPRSDGKQPRLQRKAPLCSPPSSSVLKSSLRPQSNYWEKSIVITAAAAAATELRSLNTYPALLHLPGINNKAGRAVVCVVRVSAYETVNREAAGRPFRGGRDSDTQDKCNETCVVDTTRGFQKSHPPCFPPLPSPINSLSTHTDTRRKAEGVFITGVSGTRQKRSK